MTLPLLRSKPIPEIRDYPLVEGPVDTFAPPLNRVSFQKSID